MPYKIGQPKASLGRPKISRGRPLEARKSGSTDYDVIR